MPESSSNSAISSVSGPDRSAGRTRTRSGGSANCPGDAASALLRLYASARQTADVTLNAIDVQTRTSFAPIHPNPSDTADATIPRIEPAISHVTGEPSG